MVAVDEDHLLFVCHLEHHHNHQNVDAKGAAVDQIAQKDQVSIGAEPDASAVFKESLLCAPGEHLGERVDARMQVSQYAYARVFGRLQKLIAYGVWRDVAGVRLGGRAEDGVDHRKRKESGLIGLIPAGAHSVSLVGRIANIVQNVAHDSPKAEIINLVCLEAKIGRRGGFWRREMRRETVAVQDEPRILG